MTAEIIALPKAPARSATALRPSVVRKALRAAPVLLILIVQIALTIRLMSYLGSDHDDEAIYIYGGHQLISELLHGGGSPFLETWYSGAPVIQPVLAALADAVGGLTAARGLSLVFMLGTTTLLFLTARRLFGYWPGVMSAALFTGLGITQSLGSLATNDALSLLLVAAAAYCAVRSADSTPWYLLIPLVLLLANATKYVSVLFDPVIICLAAFQLIPQGWFRVGQRILALSAVTIVSTTVIVVLAGGAYLKGILFTTLARKGGTQSVFGAHAATTGKIVSLSWTWLGVILVLGALALVTLAQRRPGWRTHGPVLILLIVASLLVTLGNIRLHTDQSMEKHDDFGAWFLCIAAGYALAYLAAVVRRWRVRLSVLALATAVVVLCGFYSSQMSSFKGFFKTTTVAAYTQDSYSFLTPYLKPGDSEYLLASLDDYVMVYGNHVPLHWWQFFDDTYVKYPIPGRGGLVHDGTDGLVCGDEDGLAPVSDPDCMYLEGEAAYVAAIRAHWFALVTLANDHGLHSDKAILAAVKATPGYVQVSSQGGGPTFIYTPDYPGASH